VAPTTLNSFGELYDAVNAAGDWLDAHNGIGGPEIAMRVAKVAEEAGEAIGAWIGLTGQNPRKGVTHTCDDVAGELADAAFAALVAIRSLGYDPSCVMAECARKVGRRVGEQRGEG
jgi:phosphoribosyl-ATP pyrophosphohydrolase